MHIRSAPRRYVPLHNAFHGLIVDDILSHTEYLNRDIRSDCHKIQKSLAGIIIPHYHHVLIIEIPHRKQQFAAVIPKRFADLFRLPAEIPSRLGTFLVKHIDIPAQIPLVSAAQIDTICSVRKAFRHNRIGRQSCPGHCCR